MTLYGKKILCFLRFVRLFEKKFILVRKAFSEKINFNNKSNFLNNTQEALLKQKMEKDVL